MKSNLELVTSCLVAIIVLLVIHVSRRRQSRAIPPHLQGKCGDISRLWSRDCFFHLDFSIKLHTDMTLTVRSHNQKGSAYLVDSLFGRTMIHTIAPENLQTIYTQGKEFGIQPSRLPAMEHFCGQGFLTADGLVWHQSRKMLKPTFSKANISDLSFLDKETTAMVSKITEGSTIDLQELLLVAVRNHDVHIFAQLTIAVLKHFNPFLARGRFNCRYLRGPMHRGSVHKCFPRVTDGYWNATDARPSQVFGTI